MLKRLQHLNENVGIVNGDSCLRLGFGPHSVDTFCLVWLLLVWCCWSRLSLWRHGTHVSCRPRFWGHCLQGLLSSIPICFPTLQWSRQFKCGRPFYDFGLDCLLLYWGLSILNEIVGTGPIATHLDPACAQTMPCLPKTLVTCPWQARLLQKSCVRRIQYDNKGNTLPVRQNK